jgi:tRNA threonylcarbamoyl adenosine modification protein YeaZ
MKILALEFSSHQKSVALLETGRGSEHIFQEVVATDYPGRPLEMIAEALGRAHADRASVDRLVVGLGPGSYGGIRSAISLAQGWHLALGTPLSGLSSVATLAAAAHERGLRGVASFVIDAQRGEFYRADYDLAEAGPVEVGKLRIVPAAEISDLAGSGHLLIGSQPMKMCPQLNVIPPSAGVLSRLVSANPLDLKPEQLEPIYLRETTFVKAPPPRFT